MNFYINIKILQAAVGKQPHWNHTIFSDRAAIPEVSLSETVSSPQSSHTLPTARYESLMSISHKHVFTYSNLATRCRKVTIMTFMAYPLPGYTVSFVPQNKIFCYQGAIYFLKSTFIR